MDFKEDIPVDLAKAAHAGTSFDPERRAEAERAEYEGVLAGDWERLSKLATTEEKRARLAEEFARYREGYRRRYRAYLLSLSRCVSVMIVGPARYPVARMERRNAVVDRRRSELMAFRERALNAIRKALFPELAPIMAGDEDAVDRLKAKIEEAERLHERMKAANAAIRERAGEGVEAQVSSLVALGFSEAEARRLLVPDCMGRVGFPSWKLTNNAANIRRMKERLSSIERNKATPATMLEGTAARFEDCPADNRVRLWFPGKPDAAVRETLKRGGFRWTPSMGCWQAYRNPHALELARKVAGV